MTSVGNVAREHEGGEFGWVCIAFGRCFLHVWLL